jgi:hypothetical protein
VRMYGTGDRRPPPGSLSTEQSSQVPNKKLIKENIINTYVRTYIHTANETAETEMLGKLRGPTVTEEVGEAKDKANEGGGNGEEGKQLHSWLVKHDHKAYLSSRYKLRELKNLQTR